MLALLVIVAAIVVVGSVVGSVVGLGDDDGDDDDGDGGAVVVSAAAVSVVVGDAVVDVVVDDVGVDVLAPLFVVQSSSSQPAIDPVSSSSSSATYRLQAPQAGAPTKEVSKGPCGPKDEISVLHTE